MADPRRLLDDAGGSPLGRSLLASAQHDRPSPKSRARTARRLGIAAVLLAGTGAGSEIGAAAAVWKIAAVVVAIGGTVGLAIWRGPSSEPVPPQGRAVSAVHSDGRSGAGSSTMGGATKPDLPAAGAPGEAPQAALHVPSAPGAAVAAVPRPTVRVAAAPAPRHPAAPMPAVAIAPAVPTAPEAASAAAPVAADQATPAEPPASEPAQPAPSAEPAAEAPAAEPPPPPVAPTAAAPRPALTPRRLAAEVALVDRARDALRIGDHPAALAALAAYHQQFPQGDLDAEADLVMIETLIAQRDYPGARDLVAGFLARFPRSPLTQRVHSLLDHLPSK